MTVEEEPASVEIRTARRDWAGLLGLAAYLLILAVLLGPAAWVSRGSLNGLPLWSGLVLLALACACIAEVMWVRTFGVVLTPEAAEVRAVRRRTVPWQDVQAEIRHRRAGTSCVRLVLQNGREVTLRAPTTYWRIGRAHYDREFRLIERWWIAHRGPQWRSVNSDPPLPSLPPGW